MRTLSSGSKDLTVMTSASMYTPPKSRIRRRRSMSALWATSRTANPLLSTCSGRDTWLWAFVNTNGRRHRTEYAKFAFHRPDTCASAEAAATPAKVANSQQIWARGRKTPALNAASRTARFVLSEHAQIFSTLDPVDHAHCGWLNNEPD